MLSLTLVKHLHINDLWYVANSTFSMIKCMELDNREHPVLFTSTVEENIGTKIYNKTVKDEQWDLLRSECLENQLLQRHRIRK